jgi:hypothetical protein
LAASIVAVLLFFQIAEARDSRPWKPTRAESAAVGSLGHRMNLNTVTIISGNLNGTYLSVDYDLSAVLDISHEPRVLPTIGKSDGTRLRTTANGTSAVGERT